MAEGDSPRILLVEDEELVREMALAALEGTYAVTAVGSFGEARSLLQGRDFALLFTDIVLPGGGNGLQLGQIARELRPDLPILYTTGFYEALNFRSSTLHGPVLEKPYTPDQVRRQIRLLLDGTGHPAGPHPG